MFADQTSTIGQKTVRINLKIVTIAENHVVGQFGADKSSQSDRLDEAGIRPETIARAFARSVRHVKGRLALAGLDAPVLDALRAGHISLDVAKALTMAGSPEMQGAMLDKTEFLLDLLAWQMDRGESWYSNSADTSGYHPEGGRQLAQRSETCRRLGKAIRL